MNILILKYVVGFFIASGLLAYYKWRTRTLKRKLQEALDDNHNLVRMIRVTEQSNEAKKAKDAQRKDNKDLHTVNPNDPWSGLRK